MITTTNPVMAFFRVLMLAFATLALAACGGGSDGGDATSFPSTHTLKVSSNNVTVSLDKDANMSYPQTVTFTVKDENGNPAGGTIKLGLPSVMVADANGSEHAVRLVAISGSSLSGSDLKVDSTTGQATLTIAANVNGTGYITSKLIDSVGSTAKGPAIKITSTVTGGDVTDPTDPTDPNPPVASIELQGLAITAAGAPVDGSNPVRNGVNGQARVTLVDANGAPMPNRIVAFALTGTDGEPLNAGALAPSSGLVQTNASGVASITVTAGDGGETAGYLVAAYSPVSGGNSITATTAFTTLGDAPPGESTSALSVTVTFDRTNISNGNPGTATIQLDAGGSTQSIANQLIEVSATAGLLNPQSGMVMTNASGAATVTVLDNGVQTAGLLTATHVSTSGVAGASGAAAFELAGDASSATEPLPSIDVTLSNVNISEAAPATVTIQLNENGSGVSIANQLIRVTTEWGELDPATGMVLTNAAGVATIILRDGGIQTAGAVTATLADNASVSGKANFQMAGDRQNQGPELPLLSVSLSNTSIADATPATATITLDANGTGLDVANQVITVTTTAGLLTPASGMVLTNAAGVATITLRDNGVETAGVLSASLLDNTTVAGSAAFSLAGDATATTTPTARLTVSFANSAIDNANPGVATITLDANGTTQSVANQVIEVTATAGLLEPASGMVMTDATGVATITLKDNGIETAGILAAQLFGNADVKGDAAFTLAGDGNTVAQPTIDVTLSSTSIDAATPATVTIQLNDNGTGISLAGQVIKVTTDAGVLNPASGMVLTDGTGAATIALHDGGVQTAGTVTATLADNASVSGTATFTMAGDGAQGPALPLLSVSLSNTSIADATPATATITLDANGTGLDVASQIIQLTATAGKVTPAIAVMTDASGQATVLIEDNGIEAVGVLSVTLQANSAVTASAAYLLAGDATVSTPQPSLSAPAFVDASNAPIGTFANPITAAAPAFASVILQDSNSVPIINAAVEFALSSSGVGSLSQASALTDATGKATVQLNAGTVQGAGTLIATYTDPVDSSVTATSQASFAVQIGSGTGPTLTTPELKNGVDDVGTTSKPINSNLPATVRVVLTDNAVPVPNKVITFTLNGAPGVGALDPATGTALTDGSGVATITLNSGANEGAATLIASYNDGEAISQIDFTTKGAGQTVSQEIDIGQLTGGVFTNGLVAPVGLGVGSTVSVSVDIVDVTPPGPASIFTGSPVQVTFTSACVQQGNAVVSPETAISIGGHAVTTYRATSNACIADDIQATATVNGQLLSATTGSFVITPSPSSTISFIEAEPVTIGVKGASAAGVEETSTITFQVKDANGNPVSQGVAVDFAVQTGTGGFDITSAISATTDAGGYVSVVVASGTVPGVGTVKASLQTNPAIYGTGSVSVQQGVATQDRFVIAVETLNPPAGNHQGVEVQVTARAADRYGNWVPDGTRINFNTKLGDIEPSCETENGTCSVTWTSQAAQPLLFDADRASKACSGYTAAEWYRHGLPPTPWLMECLGAQLGDDRFGVNVITAWALGEESFSDLNGNNVFDNAELYIDLPEAFDDNNISGQYELPASDGVFSEDYQDLDSSGYHSAADGSYNGLSCAAGATDCSVGLINVRRAATMVLSTDAIQMGIWDTPAPLPVMALLNSPMQWGLTVLDTTGEAGGSAITGVFHVIVADMNGNAPPIGTEITIEINAGDDSVEPKILGPSSCVVSDALDPMRCTFRYSGGSGDDSLTITATSGGNGNLSVSRSFAIP